MPAFVLVGLKKWLKPPPVHRTYHKDNPCQGTTAQKPRARLWEGKLWETRAQAHLFFIYIAFCDLLKLESTWATFPAILHIFPINSVSPIRGRVTVCQAPPDVPARGAQWKPVLDTWVPCCKCRAPIPGHRTETCCFQSLLNPWGFAAVLTHFWKKPGSKFPQLGVWSNPRNRWIDTAS